MSNLQIYQKSAETGIECRISGSLKKTNKKMFLAVSAAKISLKVWLMPFGIQYPHVGEGAGQDFQGSGGMLSVAFLVSCPEDDYQKLSLPSHALPSFHQSENDYWDRQITGIPNLSHLRAQAAGYPAGIYFAWS